MLILPVSKCAIDDPDYLRPVEGFCENVVATFVEHFGPQALIRKARRDDQQRRMRHYRRLLQKIPPGAGFVVEGQRNSDGVDVVAESDIAGYRISNAIVSNDPIIYKVAFHAVSRLTARTAFGLRYNLSR